MIADSNAFERRDGDRIASPRSIDRVAIFDRASSIRPHNTTRRDATLGAKRPDTDAPPRVKKNNALAKPRR